MITNQRSEIAVLISLVPFYSTLFGVILVVPVLFRAATNAGRVWFIEALGAQEYQGLVKRLFMEGKVRHFMLGVFISSGLTALAAYILFLFYASPSRQVYSYLFSLGIFAYAMSIILQGFIFKRRLLKSPEGA